MRKAVWLSKVGLAAFCALALVAGSAMAQGGRDNVRFKKGDTWISVKITKESYKGVEAQGKGKRMPWEIQAIKHGDQSLNYISGESNLKQGQYERAMEKFKKVLADKKSPAWSKHYAAYGLAVCKHKMAEGGQPAALAAAAAEYAKVIKDKADGIKVPDAKFGEGQCYYEAHQLDKAKAVFEQMVKSDYGAFWQMKGKLWLGRILLDQGKGAEAAAVFNEVATAAKGKDDMSEIYYEAQLSRAQGLILDKKFEEARKLLTSVFDEAQEDNIKAAAHNGLGDAFRAEKRVREARLEYLRVIVLYLNSPEERARALFFAADCFQQMKDAGNARRFQAMLKQNYPESVWARRLGG